MTFKNHYNASAFQEHRFEAVNTQPSQTIPGQSFTVKELLARQARGLKNYSGRVPIYDGDDFVPDFDKMDLVDRQNFIAEQRQKMADLQKSMRDREDKAKKEKADKAARAKFEAEQKALESNTPVAGKQPGSSGAVPGSGA